MADLLDQQYALADAMVAALSDLRLDSSVLVDDLVRACPDGKAIRANLPSTSTPRQECLQLIRCCSRYPSGMRCLHRVLMQHLQQENCWPALERVLAALMESQSSPQKVYISYAWGDSTTEGIRRGELVDNLCNAMQEAGIAILRDREQVKPGERISAFMKELAKGDLILVVLSDHYLKSENCMFELYNIWTRAAHDPEQFLKRVIPLTLPDAQIQNTIDKVNRGLYWQTQKDDLEASGGLNVMGTITFEKFNLIKQFCQHTADMLTLLMDKNEPRDFDRQAEEGFREVLDQILAARAAAGG